jgi:hypothetical protein
MNPDFIDDNAQEAVAASFLQKFPEYFGSENNARLMAQGVRQCVEQGRPFSTDTLTLVYNHLRASGQLEELPEQEAIELSHAEQVHQHDVAELAKIEDKLTDADFDKALGRFMWVPMTNGRVWRD